MSVVNDETNGSFFKTRAFAWFGLFVLLVFSSFLILNLNLAGLFVDRIVQEVTERSTSPATLKSPYSAMLIISSNTMLAQMASVLVILIGAFACWKFWRIIDDFEKFREQMFKLVIGFLGLYLFLIFNGAGALTSGLFDGRYGKNMAWSESHFVKITLGDQVDVLRKYNAKGSPYLGRETDSCNKNGPSAPKSSCESSVAKNLDLLKKVPASKVAENCAKNIFCVSNTAINTTIFLYYLALLISISAAFIGVGAAYMNMLDITTSSKRSAVKETLIEHRERANNLRAVLYYGSAVLVISIVWMTLHTRWVIPEVANHTTFKVSQFYSNFIVYMTLFYVMMLLFSYLPPMRWLQVQVIKKYSDDISSMGLQNVKANPIKEWRVKNGYDSIDIASGDYGAMFAPIASLVLSGNLDMAKFFNSISG